MSDNEVTKKTQLMQELQNAARSLLNYSECKDFRIRVEGSSPAVYLSFSEGRIFPAHPSIDFHVEQRVAPGLSKY